MKHLGRLDCHLHRCIGERFCKLTFYLGLEQQESMQRGTSSPLSNSWRPINHKIIRMARVGWVAGCDGTEDRRMGRRNRKEWDSKGFGWLRVEKKIPRVNKWYHNIPSIGSQPSVRRLLPSSYNFHLQVQYRDGKNHCLPIPAQLIIAAKFPPD